VSRQNEKTININVQQNLYAMPCGTLRIAKRYLQAEKRATTRSSTFHFIRASQNKKSLPFPTATRLKISSEM
jgi:hypothetical protein